MSRRGHGHGRETDRGIPHNFHVRSPGEFTFVRNAHLQMTGTIEVV